MKVFTQGFFIVAAMMFAPMAVGAPQTFNTALPIGKSEFVFREQFAYRRATDDPSPTDREASVISGLSVLGYGVTGNLSIFGVLPYNDKELEASTSGDFVTRDTSGFADVRLFTRYTVYKNDSQGSTFRVAPFFGVEMPTGKDDDSDNFGQLPAPLQPGSGSWDRFGGIVVTYQTLDFQIDTQISFKKNTEANNFEFGDEVRIDSSLQYRICPQGLGADVHGFLYAVLEGNFLYADHNKKNGVSDINSGGKSFYLSPGLQYVTNRWIIETILQLPLSQELNGAGLEDDFIVRAGFRLNF